MTFDITRWTRQTLAFNSGALVLDGPLTENGPALFTYQSAADALATIAAANYFSSQVRDLAVGDVIIVNGSDASSMYIVATVDRDAETITVNSFTASGVVGTANIQDGAVTTAKIADGNVTSAKLEDGLIHHLQVDVSLAEFIGSYTASVELVAAPGAGKKLMLHRATLAVNYGGTVLAAGGASHIQYDDTANGAGTKATGTIAAATLIAATADTTFGFTPVDTTLVDSATLNQGLFFAMATADFTGGTLSTYKIDVWYSIVDLA
jgi:hypothetical protein